jgi:hypothetical protein
MNSVFSWRRFLQLLSAHWSESRKRYMGFLLMASLVNVILLLAFINDPSHKYLMFQYEIQTAWFTVGLFVTGSIFAGTHFRQLADPGAELILLMRPASVYEKWLLSVLVVSVLYPLIYTALYCLLNYPVVQLAKYWHQAIPDCRDCHTDFSLFFPLLSNGLPRAGEEIAGPTVGTQLFVLQLFWTVQALLLAGTVFFRQSAVLRTALVMFLLWIGLLAHLPAPVMAFWLTTSREWAMLSTTELALSALTLPVLLLLLWTTLLFNLREREVV